MLMRNARRPAPRRGIILMVVVAILAIFAILGVTFVLYSDNEARSARIAREAEDLTRPDMDPELAMSLFLGQLIFGVPDDARGVGSGIRGHDLARDMYGYNPPPPLGTGGNYIPFDGTGNLSYALGPNPPFLNGQDNANLVNYTYFPGDGFLRDPARLGVRTNLQSPPGPYTGGLNPPYTYPDLNHMYLAALAPSGRVVAKSFHRDWLFGTLARTNLNWTNSIGKYLTLRPRPGDHAGFPYPDDPYGDVKNLPGAPGGNDSIWIDIGAPVMTAPDGRKYKPLFAPLIVSLDGRVNVNIHGNILGDAAGNYGHRSNQGFGPWEVNLGKVLPALKGGGPAFEWQDLFRGNGSTITGKYGPNLVPSSGQTAPGALASHFYAQIDPDGREEAPPGTNGPTSRIVLPGFPGSPPGLQPWPVFPAGYGNGRPEERLNHPILFDVFKPPRYTPPNDDRVFAASEMDAVLRYGDTGSPALTSDLFRLLPRNLANAYRRRLITTVGHLDSTAPGLPPIIYNPANAPYRVDISPGQDHAAAPSGDAFVFPDPFTQRTNALPPGSEFLADWRGRKGIGYQPGVPSRERIGLTPKLPSYPHQGQGPDGGGAPLVPTYGARWDDNGVVGFAQIQEQYSMAQTARQSLADHFYRRLLKLTGVPPVSTVAPSDPGVPTNAELMPRRWLAQLAVNIVDYIDEDDICTPFNFYTAQDAQTAPGMVSPNYNPGATTGNLLSDPTMPDPQLPRYWVFGTEMPSVVVNEVLAEYKIPAGVGNTTPLPHPVKLWVELYNARTPTPPAVAGTPLQTVDGVNVPLWVPPPNGATTSTAPNAANAYGAYRLEVSTGLHKTPTGTYLNPSPLNDNVLGKPRDYVGVPTAGAVRSKAFPLIVNFGNPAGTPPPQPIKQRDGMALPGLNPAQLPPGGYLIAAPPDPMDPDFSDPLHPVAPATSAVPAATPVMETTDLEYNRLYTSNPPNPAAADADTDERNTGLTVFLRRLANPSMPLDERLTIMGPGGGMIPNPYYNPYVTVDYIDKNPLQNTSATARGKRQPYAGFTKLQPWPNPPPELPRAVPLAADSPVANQQLDPAVVNPDPNTVHTFGVQNNPPPNLSPDFPNGRYDWLVHLDRWPVSPLELLHVSGFQPHQLTQRFVYPYDISNPVNLNAPVQAQRHMAPWFDPHRRLYRLFAFLDGMYRLNNAPPYRDAGKIDLNAINSVDVFRALCDAQPGNYFTENATTPPDDVYRIFNRMMAQRTPNVVKFPEGNFRVPGPNDRPFLGTATGPMVTTTTASAVAGPPAPPAANAPEIIQVTSLSGTAAGVRWAIRPGSWVIVGTGNMAGSAREPVYVTAVDNTVMPPTFTAIFNQSHPMGSPVAPVGIEDTWLRSYGDPSQPAQQRLFEVPPKPAAVGAPPPDHPYLRYELMRKIANNITTRSNTFAVWVTVGFFEVVDDTTVPPKLGAEIGRDQGRHVRHRFFAIVDRSNLQLWETFSQNANPITLPAPPAQQLVTGVITIDPTQIQGFASGVLQVGMPLYIDVGQNQEKVIVTKIAQNANPALQDLTVIFTKNHAARFLVRAFGNPGPQPRFRPANHPEIVRYFTVIE